MRNEVAYEIVTRVGGDAGTPGLVGPDRCPAPEKPKRLVLLRTAGWKDLDFGMDEFLGLTVIQPLAETGVEIEMIPYPSDAYNTQVTTQLQAGNAADMMVLAPGTGQAISVVTLAEADFLEPLDDTSAAVIPEGTENLYEVDGEIYGQPTALAPVGLIYNGAGGEEVGIEAYPETFDELLEACVSDLPYNSGDRVALMVNGLGGTPISELYILYRRAHSQLAERGITVGRSYVNEYCTSLDMAGASLTLVRLDDEIESLLGAPAEVPVRVF